MPHLQTSMTYCGFLLPGGVAGTPWHFVNGVELVKNAVPLTMEEYRAIIDSLLPSSDNVPVQSYLVSKFVTLVTVICDSVATEPRITAECIHLMHKSTISRGCPVVVPILGSGM